MVMVSREAGNELGLSESVFMVKPNSLHIYWLDYGVATFNAFA